MNFCHRVTRFIFLILTLKSRNLLPFLGWNSKWSHCKQYKRIKMSLYPLKMAPTLISIIRFSSYYDYSLCYGKYSFESTYMHLWLHNVVGTFLKNPPCILFWMASFFCLRPKKFKAKEIKNSNTQGKDSNWSLNINFLIKSD